MGLKGVFPTLTIRVSSHMPPLETRSRTYKQEARLYELQFHAGKERAGALPTLESAVGIRSLLPVLGRRP